jgi:hypothetical protein
MSNLTDGIVVSPEVAEIDRDRNITCELIQAATDIIACDPKESPHLEEIRPVAVNFLKDWLNRKKPQLEKMPSI